MKTYSADTFSESTFDDFSGVNQQPEAIQAYLSCLNGRPILACGSVAKHVQRSLLHNPKNCTLTL